MLALFKRKSNLPSKKTPSLSEREKKRMNFDLHFLSDEDNKISIFVSDRSSILIDGKTVYNSEEQIIEVAIGKNTILVATDHPEFHRPHPYSMPLTKQNGNVFALDMSGNLLWRIEDIVELFPDPFRGVWIIADKDREETYFSAITALGEVDYVNLEKTFFKINGRDMQKEINTSIHTLAVGSSAVVVITDDPDLHNKSVSDGYYAKQYAI